MCHCLEFLRVPVGILLLYVSEVFRLFYVVLEIL